MARYIDADALIERLKFKRDTDNIDRNKYAGLECAIAQCKKAPTADVVPRAEAVWNQSKSKFGFGQSNCSVCNGYVEGYTSYRFCPHCGAKIVGIKETNGEAE